jgi:hypothetical protein
MLPSTSKWIVLFLLGISVPVFARQDAYAEPDSIVLKSGNVARGVIIRNTSTAVLIQERYGENEYPKSEIVRIHDGADVGLEFTEVSRAGDLPSWRVMVNDIRNNDAIKSLEQIPATYIDNGIYKNVPYMSFRINKFIEMNVYGDPDEPAAIEFGIYGKSSDNEKLRRTLRSFMAGFLSSRTEVAAIYAIPFEGGEKNVGKISMKITPETAPDAYGAWWICIYNPKTLHSARLSESKYKSLTKPFDQVVNKSGRVRNKYWPEHDLNLSEKVRKMGERAPVFMRGFYRDAQGDFRLLSEKTKPTKL